jgi:hypothetical protein
MIVRSYVGVIVRRRVIREEDARRRASVEAAIGHYYDHLSDTERREQEAWGRFALEQLSPAKFQVTLTRLPRG